MEEKYTFELNSARNDEKYTEREYNSHTAVVEVFSHIVNGKSLDKFKGNVADKSVDYIKELARKADSGDDKAISELNTIRKYSIQPELLKEMELLNFFGSYENVGYGETIEREVVNTEGELSRIQAANGDVPFGFIATKKYAVSTETISAGYQVDYRKILHGDLTSENILKENIKRDITNKAARYVFRKIYNSVKNATGVKNFSETAGITKAAVDAAIKFARRFGVPSIVGDFTVVSQINDFAPYVTTQNANYMNISQEAMDEIRKTGLLSWYNGSPIYAMQNGFDTSHLNTAETGFDTIAPEGVLFVIPNGITSPIKLWTRGGLDTYTGRDITTGRELTRFDMEVAADIAQGREYEIGIVSDSNYAI